MQTPPPFPLRRVAAVLTLLLTVGLVAPATGQEGDGYPDTGVTRTVEMTFPLPEGSGYSYSDTYFSPRSGGRIHRATDVMADKMVPIHAVVDGEICFITGIDEPMPHYGYMIRLCGDDGFRYSYVHINNDTPGTDDGEGGIEHAYAPGIELGSRVERGDHIAWVGDSGNAEHTAPHLHFEIFDETMTEQEGRLNPYPSLLAAEARADYPDAPAPQPNPSPSTPAPTDDSDDDSDDSDESGESDDDPTDGATDEPNPSSALSDPTPTESERSGAYTRLAGGDRISTAIALSRETREAARAVVVVPAGSHVEALLAAPLAGLIDAPVLLSAPEGLSDAATAEIQRLGPLSAYVIGSTSQLSDGILRDLTDAGVRNHARLTASNRYSLSAAIAKEILSYPQSSMDEVLLALGEAEEASRAWPDALSASALAARNLSPILLTPGDRLPDDIADLLTVHRPADVLVIGGVAAITDDVAAEAGALARATVTRLGGDTRYATSVAVAEEAQRAGLRDDAIWIATGLNFPDALAAGPAAAQAGSPLVLIDGLNADGAPVSTAWLADNALELMVIGGPAVITDVVAETLAR